MTIIIETEIQIKELVNSKIINIQIQKSKKIHFQRISIIKIIN